jgi:MazG family protein
VECPWDREQDERSIVPHTVEEAYELADAAHSGDDAKLVDELGDVLFQVYFLSLLLEERGAGDLAEVVEHHMAKLVRRHPHVFGEAEAKSAADVVDRWHAIKRDERGGHALGDLPENLPALIRARKLQDRAVRAGLAPDREAAESAAAAESRLGDLPDADLSRDAAFDYIGALLFDVVDAARALGVDPELALSAAATRFGMEIEEGTQQ